MTVSLKVIAAALGIAGAGGGIFYATTRTVGNSISPSPEVPTNIPSTDGNLKREQNFKTSSFRAPKKGNCQISDSFGRNSIFEGLKIDPSSYTIIYCSGDNSETIEKGIVNQWTGLFHDDLIEDSFSSSLTFGKDLVLKMKIEPKVGANGNSQISFESDKLVNVTVVGEAGDNYQTISDKKVTTVKVKSEKHRSVKEIYLLLGQTI